MPYKIVSYIEDNKIFVNAVPNGWEVDGNLFWTDDWTVRPCKIKASNIPNLKTGLQLEQQYIDLTDTESEERYLRNIRTARQHPEKRQVLVQQKDYNEIMLNYQEDKGLYTTDENEYITMLPVLDGTSSINNYILDESAPNMLVQNTNICPEAEANENIVNCNCQIKINEMERTMQILTEKICGIDIKLDLLKKLNDIHEMIKNMPSKSDHQEKEKTKKLVKKFNFPIENHENMLLQEDNLKDVSFKEEMFCKLSEIGGRDGNQISSSIGLKLSIPMFLVKKFW